MKVTVIKGSELDTGLSQRWSEIRSSDPNLASPYFAEQFTLAVASARTDVLIGVIEDSGKIVGFFPYHRRRWGVALPVGLGLSDYHGVVIHPETSWSVQELISKCGLVRWEFDHLVGSQSDRLGPSLSMEASPIIQVSDGYAAYIAGQSNVGRKQIREQNESEPSWKPALGHYVTSKTAANIQICTR
jgi:CelD/BcsL family acetyltransferase involved in cellulose biosynthesis